MTTTEQVTTTTPDVQTELTLRVMPFTPTLFTETMIENPPERKMSDSPFDKVAANILPDVIDWEMASRTLTAILRRTDSSTKQCILEAVLKRLGDLSFDKSNASIDFLHFNMFLANNLNRNGAFLSSSELEWVLKNLSLSFDDLPVDRIQRQAEKHVETIIQVIHPQIIDVMFPQGGYSILENNINLEKVTPSVAEVVAKNAVDIMERVSMGTDDMVGNQQFSTALAEAIVNELNILRTPHGYIDPKPEQTPEEVAGEKEAREKSPKNLFIGKLALVIHGVLSQANPQIPGRRPPSSVGSFNFDMPNAIADFDRKFYQGYSHLFAPSALAKLLGKSEREFLEDPEYNSIIEIASQYLPVMGNPYDGHRKTNFDFRNIVRVDRSENKRVVTQQKMNEFEPVVSSNLGSVERVILSTLASYSTTLTE